MADASRNYPQTFPVISYRRIYKVVSGRWYLYSSFVSYRHTICYMWQFAFCRILPWYISWNKNQENMVIFISSQIYNVCVIERIGQRVGTIIAIFGICWWSMTIYMLLAMPTTLERKSCSHFGYFDPLWEMGPLCTLIVDSKRGFDAVKCLCQLILGTLYYQHYIHCMSNVNLYLWLYHRVVRDELMVSSVGGKN